MTMHIEVVIAKIRAVYPQISVTLKRMACHPVLQLEYENRKKTIGVSSTPSNPHTAIRQVLRDIRRAFGL